MSDTDRDAKRSAEALPELPSFGACPEEEDAPRPPIVDRADGAQAGRAVYTVRDMGATAAFDGERLSIQVCGRPAAFVDVSRRESASPDGKILVDQKSYGEACWNLDGVSGALIDCAGDIPIDDDDYSKAIRAMGAELAALRKVVEAAERYRLAVAAHDAGDWKSEVFWDQDEMGDEIRALRKVAASAEALIAAWPRAGRPHKCESRLMDLSRSLGDWRRTTQASPKRER